MTDGLPFVAVRLESDGSNSEGSQDAAHARRD
jgi:hypothetical protein